MASFEPPTPKKAADARTAASMLDSLNLSTPAVLRDKTQAELATQNLSGYEAMRRIRDDAAQFRRDYRNWRKGDDMLTPEVLREIFLEELQKAHVIVDDKAD